MHHPIPATRNLAARGFEQLARLEQHRGSRRYAIKRPALAIATVSDKIGRPPVDVSASSERAGRSDQEVFDEDLRLKS